MIKFARTADATARTKKLCRDQDVPVWAVYSRYIADTAQFRTRIALVVGTSEQDREHAVAVLTRAGYGDITIGTDSLKTITAYSGLTGGDSDSPIAELARRALVEQLPESFSADEVGAMDNDEVIELARSNGLMGART